MIAHRRVVIDLPSSQMDDLLAATRRAAIRYGLNLIGAIPADRYDRAVAPALRTGAPSRGQSIIVVGNGGGDFWRAFGDFADRNPGWRDRANPLDDFTREVIERDVVPAVRASHGQCRVVYPFMRGGATLNFIELARLAGLGGPSIIGVLVHPVYGPWIAFRAALIVEGDLDSPGAALGFDPCPGCVPRSCIAACPAGAIAATSGWNIPRCLAHRVEVEADCSALCHARAGCVLGPAHRYPADELAYHQGRALSAMRPWYDEHLRPRHRLRPASD